MTVPAPTQHKVTTPQGFLAVRDYPGLGIPFLLLHGYPDDSTIYNKLASELQPRRVITFDFLGYGQSERSQTSPVAEGQRLSETAAVIDQLNLDQVIVVGHDASGPVAVEYAVAHPDRVARLVLLNCFFGESPTLRFPEMIRLLGDPHLAPLADALMQDLAQRQWLLEYTAEQFGYDSTADIRQKAIIPQFFGSASQPDALDAIRAWTGRLFADVAITNDVIASGQLESLRIPVDIAFGVNDPYLNTGVAEHLAGLFPSSHMHPIDARHWVQWDDPKAVAQVLLRES
ncbi:alpha/beta fold hydrolase [Streptomyces sp. NPDC058891]|uniref:alpha/beta fold hydrolase n=1 Tax=Streptomyces sp. NPDC058891 TaxID=3346667 RepID=UPI00368AC887